MAKRLALLALLFFIPALAKADSFVSVSLNPVEFWSANATNVPPQFIGPEIVGVTFVWDTTTSVISDIAITSTGAFHASPSNPTTLTDFTGHGMGSGNLLVLGLVTDFGGTATYQLNYGFHGGLVGEQLGSTPGTYPTDLGLFCGCLMGDNFAIGTATVTSLGDGDRDGDDPVSSPEPGSLLNLVVGLGVLGLTCLIGGKRHMADHSAVTASA